MAAALRGADIRPIKEQVMPEITSTVAISDPTPAVQTPKAKAKKTGTKKTMKAATKTPAKNGELRPLQVKVLKALVKADKPLSRTRLYSVLGFKNQAGLNDVLGKNDPKKRAEADKTKYPSLITLGLIKLIDRSDSDAQANEYVITGPGKKAAQKS